MVNLRDGARWLAKCPEPPKPWWEDLDYYEGDEGRLIDHATALYEALVALRAESAWEQRGPEGMVRFKSQAEVAADEILDEVVRG